MLFGQIILNTPSRLIKDPCMAGYTLLTRTGRCYMFDPWALLTWDKARSSCMDDGGDLMGHETQNELDAISSWMTPGLSQISWWRHQMESFSVLLVICAGNSPVPGEFHAQKPVTRSFDVFFDLRLNKRLSKQSWGWWFETLSCPLWRHCNVILACWRLMHYRTWSIFL